MYLQHPGEVDVYRQTARNLAEVALPPDESVRYISGLIDDSEENHGHVPFPGRHVAHE